MRITQNENEDTDILQQRQSWLKLYHKSMKPWKYESGKLVTH